MAFPVCQDDLSACFLDHAPVGSSRDDFIALRKFISDTFDKGYPFDASCLGDDWIEFIALYCSDLRINNKAIKDFHKE